MTERFEIVAKALENMLESKKYATLRDILATMNPADIAAVFADMEQERLPLLFRLLPMIAKAVKLDPAVMASPFITTIVDALSLLVYFLFAKLLLKS